MRLSHIPATVLIAALLFSGCTVPQGLPDLTGQELEQAKQDLTQKEQELTELRQIDEQKEQELSQLRQDNERLRGDLAFICEKSFSFLQARRAIDFELEQRWPLTCGQANP